MNSEAREGFALAIYFRKILHVQDVDLARQRNRPEALQLSIYGRVYIETFCDELIAYSHQCCRKVISLKSRNLDENFNIFIRAFGES